MAVGFRKLPSTKSILAFAAAARNMSFTEAAKELPEELNVTRMAVSRHVSQLEAHLEIQLFQRQRSRIEPTPAGKRLARAAFQGFRQLRRRRTARPDGTRDPIARLAPYPSTGRQDR